MAKIWFVKDQKFIKKENITPTEKRILKKTPLSILIQKVFIAEKDGKDLVFRGKKRNDLLILSKVGGDKIKNPVLIHFFREKYPVGETDTLLADKMLAVDVDEFDDDDLEIQLYIGDIDEFQFKNIQKTFDFVKSTSDAAFNTILKPLQQYYETGVNFLEASMRFASGWHRFNEILYTSFDFGLITGSPKTPLEPGYYIITPHDIDLTKLKCTFEAELLHYENEKPIDFSYVVLFIQNEKVGAIKAQIVGNALYGEDMEKIMEQIRVKPKENEVEAEKSVQKILQNAFTALAQIEILKELKIVKEKLAINPTDPELIAKNNALEQQLKSILPS
jgi:hypothetical protein